MSSMSYAQRRLFPRNGFQPRLRADEHVVHPPMGTFSANDMQKIGCTLEMMQRVLVVTLGTSAARMANRLRSIISREHGRVPGTIDYLMLDAASAEPGTERAHFKQLPDTVDGSATLFERGYESIFAQGNYQELRANIDQRVLRLFDGDPEVPTMSPRTSMAFVVVAGPGGTGGGGLHSLIGLLHEVAQARHIREPRIYVVFIGAETMIHDKHRSLLLEQKQLIRRNAAMNLGKILRDIATPGHLEEPRPDGTTFAVKASERVHSITVADHSNGYTDHATVAALTDMLAEALYLRFFTPVGNYLAQRICDPRGIGVYGRGGAQAATARGTAAFTGTPAHQDLEKLHYQFLPRQGEAVGVCSLHYPFPELWSQLHARFLQQVMGLLVRGVALPPFEDLLDEHQLGQQAITLTEWLEHNKAPTMALAQDAASLHKLADMADDLGRPDGLWKEQAAEMDDAVQDASVELVRRLEACCAQIADAYGPGAARVALAELHRLLVAAAEPWLTPEPWTNRQTEELRLTAQTLRAYIRSQSSLAKLYQYFWTKSPIKLAEGQQRKLKSELYPKIMAASQKRFEQEAGRRMRKIYEALLGRPGLPGLLEKVLDESLAQDKYFQKLAGTLAPAVAEQAESGHVIRIVSGLEATLASGRKLADLYEETLAGAGCTPEDFAAKLQHEGLLVRGRYRRPVEWSQLSLPEVCAALRATANHYLGADDPERLLDVEHPNTAFAAAAAITPSHPELQPLLENCLPLLFERSRPFAELHPVAGWTEQVHRFLICHPSVRLHLERELHGTQLANPSTTAGNTEHYATKHPFHITLAQYAIAVPLGALKVLPLWVQQMNLQALQGRPPFFDTDGCPEVRRLEHRPKAFEDRRQLFEAACKACVVMPTDDTAGRFTLVTVDPLLVALFAETELLPVWKGADYFLALLKKPAFVQRLKLAFPALRGLAVQATKLANEHNAVLVAQALVDLGILEAGDSPQHFRILSQSAALPLDLFEKRSTSTRGLTKEQCIALLDHHGDGENRCHDLYNYVFWQVRDALELQRISRNDVPPFLLNHARSL